MPVATRDRLRQRFLDRHADLISPAPRGQVVAGNGVHRPLVRSDERAIGYVPYRRDSLPDPLPATLVAFYLPQFHTIPENDEWWGKGFTEWRNVTRALPQFEGHHQPRLPGDLGFYDLRNPQVMHEQARLAREYGISAFCFYFYWFGGKTLLETPLRNWLADKTIDLQFCLCWANEKWSRTWDGRGDEILIDQQHSPEDDVTFISHVAEYMRDPRYLRVDGKPMLLVYRPGLFPDMKATAERWRTWCLANGVGEIHLAYVQSFERPRPDTLGFDAAVEFPPNLTLASPIASEQRILNPSYEGSILDWRKLAEERCGQAQPDYLLYPATNPGWDNEARRPGKGRSFINASPIGYRDWMTHAVSQRLAPAAPAHRIVFINAWNEWAEGAVLEPDARLGYAYLDANRQALNASVKGRPHEDKSVNVVIHAWHIEEFVEILDALRRAEMHWRILVTTPPQNETAVRSALVRHDMPHEILVCENRGRDILPFLKAAMKLANDGIEFALKLHTKRSSHMKHGSTWRHELINRLISSPRSRQISDALLQDPTLGLVVPEGHLLSTHDYMGANLSDTQYLLRRMGYPASFRHGDKFPSGSMFWFRPAALRPLLECHLLESEFEEEAGQLDGTLAHAIERVFGVCTHLAGFHVATAASICGEPAPSSNRYHFAKKS